MEKIFGISYGGYKWAECHVYRHPLHARKYVVDSDSGCSCNYYNVPDEDTLSRYQPLTKAQARKAVADWATNKCFYDFVSDVAQERVRVIEAFNQAVK